MRVSGTAGEFEAGLALLNFSRSSHIHHYTAPPSALGHAWAHQQNVRQTLSMSRTSSSKKVRSGRPAEITRWNPLRPPKPFLELISPQTTGTPAVLLTRRLLNSALRGSFRRSLITAFAFVIHASFISPASAAFRCCRWSSCRSRSALTELSARASTSRALAKIGCSRGKQAAKASSGSRRSSLRAISVRSPACRSKSSIPAAKLEVTSATVLVL